MKAFSRLALVKSLCQTGDFEHHQLSKIDVATFMNFWTTWRARVQLHSCSPCCPTQHEKGASDGKALSLKYPAQFLEHLYWYDWPWLGSCNYSFPTSPAVSSDLKKFPKFCQRSPAPGEGLHAASNFGRIHLQCLRALAPG